MEHTWMIIGFAMAAYSIVANDSIQTLGTFLSSNTKRPWWVLWIFISGILIVTVTSGWINNGGDPAFGRLANEGKAIPFPPLGVTWIFILPPLLLVILTLTGIPVSTSLLILTAFKGLVSFQQGTDTKGAIDLFQSMMRKSLTGYLIAFVLALVIYVAVLYLLERKVSNTKNQENQLKWIIFQWASTAFLWSMWLVQDLANVFCYLPRKLEAPGFVAAIGGMVLLQGYLIKKKGGKIQKIVTSKTNTLDIRSATLIDFLYAIVLLVFKLNLIGVFPAKMPMSTTWVFLGLLAGRELGITLRLKHRSGKSVLGVIGSDSGKALMGSVMSVFLAMSLPVLAQKFTPMDGGAEVSSSQKD